MIPLKELRIGNSVFQISENRTRTVETITAILEDGVFLSNGADLHSFSQITPIPLTSDILEKSGFTFTGDNWYEMKTAFGKLNFNSQFEVCSVSDLDYSNECMINAYGSIKYVHQLQNICFWVSGKELEIRH